MINLKGYAESDDDQDAPIIQAAKEALEAIKKLVEVE